MKLNANGYPKKQSDGKIDKLDKTGIDEATSEKGS